MMEVKVCIMDARIVQLRHCTLESFFDGLLVAFLIDEVDYVDVSVFSDQWLDMPSQ